MHEGNGCEWVDVSWKLVRVGGSGLKMSGSGLKMSRSDWEWVRVGGSRWEWVEVDGNGWEWIGVDGSGWQQGLVQPIQTVDSVELQSVS